MDPSETREDIPELQMPEVDQGFPDSEEGLLGEKLSNKMNSSLVYS
jgi:hypothetical protein